MPRESTAGQGTAAHVDDSSTELRNDLLGMLDKVGSKGDPLDQWLGPLAGLLISRWAAHDESKREAAAAANNRAFDPGLPEALRLPAWDGPVANQADAVAEALRRMTSLDGAGSGAACYVAQVAPLVVRSVENSPSMFKGLFDWVRRLDLGTPQGRAVAAHLFDDVLRAAVNKQGKLLGEFVTPRPVVDFMLELAKPAPGDRIYDPCFGYGGILTGAAHRLRSTARTGSRGEKVHVRHSGVFGVEINRFSYATGVCRALLAGIDRPGLELGDALERRLPGDSSSGGFDCILGVPPWGHRYGSHTLVESPFQFPSKRYENLFLQHVMANLRPGGRAVVAVPDGVLFGSGSDRDLREVLLSDFRVDAVVSLPEGTFAPHTGIRVNLVVFRRENPASAVRFVVVSRKPWEAVSLSHSPGGGIRRPGPQALGLSCRSLAKAIFSESGGSVLSGIKAWDVPVRELATRNYDLVAKESGAEALNTELDGLRQADPSLRYKRLDCVADVFRGRSYNRRVTTENRNSPDVVAGLLRVNDVTHKPIQAPSLFLTGEGKDLLKRESVLRPGDVVITTGGTIGKTGMIPDDFDGAIESVATGNLTVARAKKGIKPEFLSSILGSPTYQNWLAGHARGTTIQHLSIRSLRNLMIPVPSVPVQDAVLSEVLGTAGILSTTSQELLYFGETDAMATLARVLSGAAKDPIAAWLEMSIVAEMVVKGKGAIPDAWGALLECVKLLGILFNSLPDESLDDMDPLVSLAIQEARSAQLTLVFGRLVPEGSGRSVVLERARGELGLALRELSSANGPYVGRLSQFIALMFNLAGQEIDAMRDSVRIDIDLETDEVPVRTDSEVQLRLTNSSPVPLFHLQVSTLPPVGEKTIPFLADRETLNVPLTVRPQDTAHPFQIAVSWLAFHLDWMPVTGEKLVHLRVLSTCEAVRNADLGASPYIVGNPVDRQEMFFGRDDIMDRIRRQLGAQANVILLEGNRRTGKTSILGQLGKADVLSGWIPVYCSFQDADGDDTSGGIATRNVFRLLAREIGWALYDAGVETWFPGLPDRDPARPFKLAFRSALNQTFAGEHVFEALEFYIESALQAARPRRVLLMLDEFDKLQEGIDAGVTSPQVPENIRHLLHHQSGLSAIITGSRRLKRLREEYWSALFGFGHRIGVSALSAKDARRLVTEPVDGRLDYMPQARDRIVSLCARHPFLIQSLCNRVFEQAVSRSTRTITLDVVERAATEMVDDNEHFRTLWDYVGSTRRRIILVFCDRLAKGSDPVNLDLLGVKLHESRVPFRQLREIGDDVNVLRELELLDFDEQHRRRAYRLAIPLMAKWLRMNVDFDDLLVRARQEVVEIQR